jgi:hypothetical protein
MAPFMAQLPGLEFNQFADGSDRELWEFSITAIDAILCRSVTVGNFYRVFGMGINGYERAMPMATNAH